MIVTVPPGISPGQAIIVTAPDGSGRTVMVTVPQGMVAGSTFMAEFPPSASSPSVVSSSVAAAPAGPPRPAQVEVEPVDYSEMQVLPPPPATTQTSEPFAQAVPINAGPNDTTISSSPNRQPLPTPISPPQRQPTTVAPSSTNNQKLLLVRVPPGTSAGSTIHVSIPDEPGRLVAATVPPNVSEFHVAFTPNDGGSNANGVSRGHSQQNSGNRTGVPRSNFNNSHMNNNRNSGGMGSFLLPALGGAALGMAGMSMYDHARYNNSAGYDNSNNGETVNDGYGGSDFDGDFDGGGFGDFGDF